MFQGLGNELWLLVPAFFFALLAGALIGRVLGIHRSFSTSSFTGVIGWIAGTLIALWVATDTDPPTENWPRNLFLFTLLGTMAAAVWIEFVSRPGHRRPRPDRAVVGAAPVPFAAPPRPPGAALRRDHTHRGAQRPRPVARASAARTTATGPPRAAARPSGACAWRSRSAAACS